MKKLSKKILVGIMAGTFLFAGGNVYAEENNPPQPPPQVTADLNRWAKDTAEWYGVSESEIQDALKKGVPFDDIEHAAMLAKISGKSFKTVMGMKADWFDVMQKLNITPEKYESVMREMMIQSIARRSELPESTVKNLLENHYNPRDIRIAGRLAKASGKDVQSVLDMKKLNQRWMDIAQELGVDRDLVRPHGPVEEAEDEGQTEQQ